MLEPECILSWWLRCLQFLDHAQRRGLTISLCGAYLSLKMCVSAVSIGSPELGP